MPNVQQRQIIDWFEAPTVLEGEGFEVRRPFPSARMQACGPLLLLDHFGPTHVPPGEAKGAPRHPHAGLETLTYLLEGRAHHLDSLGNSSAMGPGEVQWMRAGRGIVHDEGPDAEFRRTGGLMHGIQLWIDLPQPHRHAEPAYRHFLVDEIPVERAAGVEIRLIAGALNGQIGPVRTFAQPLVAHLTMRSASAITAQDGGADVALYVMNGQVSVANVNARAGTMMRLGEGGSCQIAAHSDAELLMIGGSRLEQLPIRAGPCVMDTQDELRSAIDGYARGEFGYC